jgi:hypothetical protein
MLTVLAAVAAIVLISVEKLKRKQAEKRAEENEAQLKKEMKRIRELVNKQRDIALHDKVYEIKLDQQKQIERSPVDVANEIIEESSRAKR